MPTATRLPEFLKRPDDVTVPLGDDAKFEVVVDGEPLPRVKWCVESCSVNWVVFVFLINTYLIIDIIIIIKGV